MLLNIHYKIFSYQQQQQQQFQEVTSQAGVAQRPRARAPADPPVQRMNAQGGMWVSALSIFSC